MVEASFCPRIDSIHFHLLGDEDIKNLSVVNVKTYETFVSNDSPVPGGLCDPRMGAIVNLYNCVTCGHNHHQCPGHFGYYNIGIPVMQPIVQEDIIKWLKIVCLKCGTLLIDPNKVADKAPRQRLQFAATLQTSYKICPECGEVHPKVKTNDDNIFFITIVKSNLSSEVMKWNDIWPILQKISNETCTLMGVSVNSHPRKYYITSMLVPPITIRPNFKNHVTNKSHRTSPLLDFEKHIIRKSKMRGTEEQNDKNALFINRCVYDMIRGGSQKRGEVRIQNVIAGSTNDALIKSLGGKKGRIRNFLMGHRGFNGARVTISGNATLHLDQVGIPQYVVQTLLFSEVVRDYNKDKIWNYIQEGRCPRIKKANTNKEHVIDQLNRDSFILEHGDVIYRHIVDGDFVNFNRQPSLKESAIGAHTAVGFQNDTQNTFQINVGVCANYNADFDGDQMLLKVLTSCRSVAEAKYITSVHRWLLSQQSAQAVNGQIQDAVVGSALLTKSGTKLDKLHAMRLFARTGITNINFDKEEYTGREIISLLLKRTPISYRTKPTYYKESYKPYIDYNEEDISVVIEKGIVKSGILDKNTIGESRSGTPFHLIALEYGTKKALEVIYQYQQIIMEYLNMRGFSMGLDNLFISKESRAAIDRIVSNKIIESNAYANRYIRGLVISPLGTTLENHYEQKQLKILSSGDNILGIILSNINSDDNDLYNMMIYGSKGKPNQMTEMMGVRGVLTLEGKRMPKLFSYGRCSTFFPRYAMDPISRGYVRDPLTEGFGPETMAYSAQSARQMVVQKSQSTALTGANQRKHIKNMENAITNSYRQTLKSHMLLQLLYGEDGFDPRYSIKQKITTVYMNNSAIKDKFRTKHKNIDKELKALIEDRDWMREILIILDVTGLEYEGFTDFMNYGIHIDSIVDEYINDKPVEVQQSTALDEKYKLVSEYIDTIYYFYSNERQKELKTRMPKYIVTAARALQVILRVKLATERLRFITTQSVKLLLDNISVKLKRSLIPAGSCVGIQAGQGVGEPLVQSMLDAVHGASSGARAGLESIKEILGSKYASPETNSMVIPCHPDIAGNKDRVSEIAEYIKRLKIIDIYKSWQIFLENLGEPVHSQYKHEAPIIKEFVKNHSTVNVNDLSRIVLRIQLDKAIITYKSISVETIVETIYKHINNVYIVYTTENADTVFLRIYVKERMLIRESNVESFIKDTLINRILNINIRGLSNILDSKVMPYKSFSTDSEGNLISKNVFSIKTVGQDLRELLGLPNELLSDIDIDNVVIGSVMDALDIYGVESARIKIIEQMMARMEGKHPNGHHLSLYGDILTWGGDVRSIEKAIYTERNKTFATASGYSAGQMLMRAALKGTTDNTANIPTPIMLGTLPKFGTNYCQYLMNEEFIMENSKNVLDILTG